MPRSSHDLQCSFAVVVDEEVMPEYDLDGDTYVESPLVQRNGSNSEALYSTPYKLLVANESDKPGFFRVTVDGVHVAQIHFNKRATRCIDGIREGNTVSELTFGLPREGREAERELDKDRMAQIGEIRVYRYEACYAGCKYLTHRTQRVPCKAPTTKSSRCFDGVTKKKCSMLSKGEYCMAVTSLGKECYGLTTVPNHSTVPRPWYNKGREMGYLSLKYRPRAALLSLGVKLPPLEPAVSQPTTQASDDSDAFTPPRDSHHPYIQPDSDKTSPESPKADTRTVVVKTCEDATESKPSLNEVIGGKMMSVMSEVDTGEPAPNSENAAADSMPQLSDPDLKFDVASIQAAVEAVHNSDTHHDRTVSSKFEPKMEIQTDGCESSERYSRLLQSTPLVKSDQNMCVKQSLSPIKSGSHGIPFVDLTDDADYIPFKMSHSFRRVSHDDDIEFMGDNECWMFDVTEVEPTLVELSEDFDAR